MRDKYRLIELLMVIAIAMSNRLSAEVLFGHGNTASIPGVKYDGYNPSDYLDFARQARFFSTSDLGFVPGGEDQLTGDKLGLKWRPGPLHVRGQDTKTRQIPRHGSWLSDGGDSLFGMAFDAPPKTNWATSVKGPGGAGQFDRFKDKIPLFDQAVIHWGALVPKPGGWGACVLDQDGNFKKIKLDNQRPLFPYAQTVVDFPPTTVKQLYFAVKGNFAEVRSIYLNLHNERLLDNRVTVQQMDAYLASYSPDQPGTLIGLLLANSYFKQKTMQAISNQGDCVLTDLAPFVELDGKRVHASKGAYPVATASKGRVDTLRYQLKFDLPGGKQTLVDVIAVYGVSLKDTVRFEFNAKNLPEGAKLGFEMTGPAALFANYATPDAAALQTAKVFATPAGPLGLDLEGADKVAVSRAGSKINFDILADGEELGVALSLPIGPEAGVQPGMLTYNWYPSLANQGDMGLAPFKMEDLELLETVNFANPDDPHPVYDITNDPLILTWRQSGEKQLPAEFGKLLFANQPERGKVPPTTALGQRCRAINNDDSSYFRFNLGVKFQPCVPYLIVVEHAFDRERRGEFHTIGLEPDGKRIVKYNLWGDTAPLGGFDTGKAPYENTFKKESVLFFCADGSKANANTIYSLCFSNCWQCNKALKELPQGLAVKSVSVYRVAHMPELPDQAALAPEGAKRHVIVHHESGESPWTLSQWPKLAGYNSVYGEGQPSAAKFLHRHGSTISRPSWEESWHPGSLAGQAWVYEKAEQLGMNVKISFQDLLALGSEDRSFEAGCYLLTDVAYSGVPLSPTRGELDKVALALDTTLPTLSKYKSFGDIAVTIGDSNFFTKRNFDDFSRETGVKLESSPVPVVNMRRLLDSDQATVDAWTKWACRKQFEFLSWLLAKARGYRSDIYLSVGFSIWCGPFQFAYYGDRPNFDRSKFPGKGINNLLDFLKLTGHDPDLYAGQDGFCFFLDQERSLCSGNTVLWPDFYQEPWFARLKAGFKGGMGIVANVYDEGPKPLAYWTCNYVRSQRDFQRDLIEALLYANARDFSLGTYYYEPYRGRLNDLRVLAVPFQLLPFAPPEEYAGKLSDPTRQAVIKKYGDRHGLINPGDLPTDVTLTLPEGADTAFDLSNGVRQELRLSNRTVKIHLEPWALKTLEIK